MKVDPYEKFASGFSKTSLSMLGHNKLFELLMRSDEDDVPLIAEELASRWRRAIESDDGRVFKFILYFPYCAQKCLYCREPSEKLSSAGQVDGFLADTLGEMEYFSSVFAERPFDYLTVNGGSPDLLSPEQMERLFASLFSRFRFSEKAERRIEINPVGMTREKLSVMKRHGFTRLSLGVQSLSKKALSYANRPYVGLPDLERVFSVAREVGFEDINADLILGLPGEDYESFEAGLRKIVSLRPAQVMVYVLNEPDERYLERYKEMDRDTFRHGVERSIAAFSNSSVLDDIRNLGYTLTPDPREVNYKYFAFVRNDIPALSWLGDMDRLINISSFSIGQRSVSNIFGDLVYERVADFSPEGKAYKAFAIDETHEMKKFVFLSVEASGRIDVELFNETFREDIRNRFGDALSILERHGRIGIRDGKIVFSDPRAQGRLMDIAFLIIGMRKRR